jgi:hypothetical protein
MFDLQIGEDLLRKFYFFRLIMGVVMEVDQIAFSLFSIVVVFHRILLFLFLAILYY